MPNIFEEYAKKKAGRDSVYPDQQNNNPKEVNEDGNDEEAQGSGSRLRVQQTVQAGDGEGTQPRQEPQQEDSRESRRGDGSRVDEAGVRSPLSQSTDQKGGGQGGKDESKDAQGEGSQDGQEDGQGLRGKEDARNQAEVTGDSGEVRPQTRNIFEEYAKAHPPKSFKEQLFSKEGLIAGAAGLAESLLELGGGAIAAGVALPEAIASGPLAPVVEGLAFPVGAELAKNIIINPAEEALGIKGRIEEAKQEAPDVATAGGILGMVPMGAKSIFNLAKVGQEFGGSEVAKRVGKAAVGGAIFEPARFVAETGLKEAGVKKDEVAPVTFGSVAMSAAQMAALGGLGAREQILREKGAKMLEDAGLTETAKAAKILLTDNAIKQKRSIETDKRVAGLFESADKLVGVNDPKNAERVLRKIESESKAFPANDALQLLRKAKIEEIRGKIEDLKGKAAEDKQKVSEAEGVGAEKGKPYEPPAPKEKDPAVKRRIKLAENHIEAGNVERASAAVDRLEKDIAQYPAREEIQNQRTQKIEELRDRIFEKQKEPRLAEALKKVESFEKGSDEHFKAFDEYLSIYNEKRPKTEEQKTSGVSTEQGKPSIGEAKGETEKGTPFGEGEGEEERLNHAALVAKHPETGATKRFTGANHDEAIDKAWDEGYVTDKFYDDHYGSRNAKNRNKDIFGYETSKGRFVNRKEGFELAKKSDQLLTDKFSYEGKEGVDLHSHEVALDKHNFIGKVDVDKYENMTVSNVLKDFSTNKSIHPSLRQLSKLILKKKNAQISLDRIVGTDPKILKENKAAALRGAGWIWLPKGGRMNAKTILHEIVHSFTADHISDYVGGNDLVGSEYFNHLRDVAKTTSETEVKQLIDLYLHSIDSVGIREKLESRANDNYFDESYDYGFHNLYEFVSEAFTNESFQNQLKRIKAPESRKSVFDRVVDAIQRLFKIPKGSVAEQVMRASFDLSQRPTQYIKGPREYTEYERWAEDPANFYKDPRPATKGEIKRSVQKMAAGAGSDEVNSILEGKLDEPKTPEGRTAFGELLRKTGLFRSELFDAGLAQGMKNAKTKLVKSLRGSLEAMEDMLDGETIPILTRLGCKPSATQFAHAKNSTHDTIMGLLAKAFPNDFANQAKLRKMTEIMAQDNILAGLDEVVNEFNTAKTERDNLLEIYDSGNAPAGTLGKIKDLEDQMQSLSASANMLRDSHDIKKYEENVQAAKGTEIEQMIESYKKHVQPELDDLYKKHKRSEDTAQETAGKYFGARINLISAKQEERIRDYYDPEKIAPRVNVVNYRNPDVKQYDPNPREGIYDPEFSKDINLILTSSYASRINEVKKMDFYDDLVDKGVAKIVKRGTTVNDIDGEKVRRLETVMPYKDPATGKVTTRNMDMYVRESAFDEIMQLLDVDTKPMSKTGWQNAVTKIQVIGIADGVSHMKGLQGIVQQAFGRDTRMKDFLSKLPIFGTVNAVREIRNYVKKIQNPDAETLQKLAFISKNVGLRPKYEQENGLQLLPMHKILHEWDTAVRLMMHDYFDNLVKRGHIEDSMDARISFINKIGEYNNRLQPRWVAQLRGNGTSPFLIGGTTMTRAGISAALGRKGFEAKSLAVAAEYRAMQLSGLVMAGTLPAIINLATTGSVYGRAGTPIGVIDFGESFDTEDGRRRSFDIFQLMSIRRGMRALGINAALEGFRQGLSSDLIFKNVGNDLFTTYAHPFIGPGIGLLYQTATGKRIDLRSGWSENYDARKVGGPLQYVENFRVGLKEQNPLVYGVLGRIGLEVPMKMAGVEYPVEEGSSAVRDVFHKEGWKVNTLFGKIAQTTFDAAVAPVMGATGGKLTSTPALKLSAQFGKKEQYTPKQDKRYEYRQEIFDAYKSGRKTEAMALFAQGLREGVLTESDKKILAGKFKEPDLLVQRTRRLKSAQEAVDVFRVATPEEQDKIYRIVRMKVAGSTTLTAQERKDMLTLLKKVVKKGSRFYTG